ncbi:PREDICTED: protein moonraker isoform X1 [Corvus brachyrhynchos]|uniref:protein moonraker isoform X1 n=1 Tax=Corvus brachyrhynchos TaxID=85066 RepID=UPI0008163AC9|nr:PREDICTED: protein moonraker isoform X1 [Corvus brachyrhynchos]
MGPSKTAVPDDAFALSTQRYGNEAKALQAQLQFNRNVPAVPENLALRFSHPRPIIIEKLKASNLVGSEDPSLKSSGMFSVVSEERLKLAVQLAKRDIKQRRLQEQVKQREFGDVVSKPWWTQKSQQQKTEVFVSRENKNALKSQSRLRCQQRLDQPSQGESASSDANTYLCVVKEGKASPAVLDSPPTHDTGPDPKPNLNKKEHKNTQEVQRLQKELRSYVQKIEEIIKKGRDRELDPENKQRLCIRRQQQAARSARMLYVLQQQVKEIQDDIEKLSPHTIKHTKKSRAVSRLAAAHRGAVRTLQAFASQFADQTDEQIPAHYKELGSLVRQLSLCSAKVEGDSSISDVIIDILLQVEDLNSLLENKQTPKTVKKCISASQAKSPRKTETFPARKHLLSPKGENKPVPLKGQLGQESKKPPCAGSLLTAVQQANSCAHILHNKYQEKSGPPIPERNATLQGSTVALVRARAVKKESVLESGALRKKDVSLPAKPQGMLKSLKSRWVHPPGKRARFREPTIAFQLKENKRPVKESKMPCMPSKAPPRSGSPKRSQTISPAHCADKDGKEVQEWSEPPLDRTQQVATNADVLSEKLLDDLLEDTAQELWSMDQHERLQTEALLVADTHSLESMLQRMEEIEMYQEAVRRRVTQIVYSDSQFWAQEDKTEQQMASTAKKLTSPHPVQITKLTGHTELETDILFEKPFDSIDIDENKEAEEKLQTGDDILQPLPLNSLQKAYSVSLSVPSDVLQSILDYNSRYKHHLKLISHEVVGSFDPWQIAESLAEQLTEQALCDVAAELQDVCEDYAEAVFTSEFLQPMH